jgi:phage shock protein PspC (stress-responsive transcriptional regulator)
MDGLMNLFIGVLTFILLGYLLLAICLPEEFS